MKTGNPPPPTDAHEEIPALIETLHQTDRRLEELTSGEVDAVVDRRGRTSLLRRAQDHLRYREGAILNVLPANVALLDPEGLITTVNESWRRFGRANALPGPGYGIGVNYLEICDSASGDDAFQAHQAAAGIRSVLDGKAKNFTLEYPCHSPAEQRWFLMTVTPLNDLHPNGAVVMHVNITERRRAEELLRESQQKLLAIFEGALDGILVSDVETGKFLTGNRAICSMLGYTQEEIVSIGISDIHRKQDLPHELEQVKKILRGDIQMSADSPVLRKDGSVFYADIKAAPIRIGGRDYLLGIFRDITERKKAERELRESEFRFSNLLGNVELVSMMLDREARITYCNEYLLRLTGWQQEEVIGENWFELFMPPELNDLKGDFFAALLANRPEALHHENEILTRSGERRLIRWSNSVLRSGDGEVIGTASIGEDITERKMAEEVLKQRAAELERFHRLSVGRELQMIELKKQVNELAIQAGQKPPYDLAFPGPEPVRTNPDHEQSS